MGERRAATYEGRPCRRCGGTERFTANRTCVVCERERSRKRWWAADPKHREKELERSRASHLQKAHRLTQAEVAALLKLQGGGCAGCGTTEPGGNGRWAIDHDHAVCPRDNHSCGRCRRAVLCTKCNAALGLLNDNPATMRRLADYVEGFGAGSRYVQGEAERALAEAVAMLMASAGALPRR